MPNWTRLTAPAAGAFSATWITRIGGLLFALILGGAFLINSCFSTVPTDPESLLEPEGIAGDRATLQLGQRVQDIEQRAALDAAAAERELAATGAQLTGGQVMPAFDPTTGETLPDGAAGPIAALTEEEAQLREVLRLEAIERRTRSLRSAPVVITYRQPPGAGSTSPAAAEAAAVPAADAPAQAGDQGPREYSCHSREPGLSPIACRLASPRFSAQRDGARRGTRASGGATDPAPAGRAVPLGAGGSREHPAGRSGQSRHRPHAQRPARMGTHLRGLVYRGRAREPAQRRLSRPGPRVRGRARSTRPTGSGL